MSVSAVDEFPKNSLELKERAYPLFNPMNYRFPGYDSNTLCIRGDQHASISLESTLGSAVITSIGWMKKCRWKRNIAI